MTFSNEAIGGGADGGIFNIYGELPIWMDHGAISMAFLEMDASVRGIQDPPIASVLSASPEPETVSEEDYRRFYVQFENNATEKDMVAALHIVTEALKKYRYAD